MAQLIPVKVWGDYACFTRPEFKVERVSYPVMTPSAARGILEAIYWKPQIRYRVLRIGVLEQGTQTTLLRNEISSRQSAPPKNKSPAAHYLVAESQRQQRTSLVLQGRMRHGRYAPVGYRIEAWIELLDGETGIGKHLGCFERRVKRGQCHHKPYLGCREFAADFEPAEDAAQPDPNLAIPIGTMLFDTAYIEDPVWFKDHPEDRVEFWRHDNSEPRVARGHAKRLFFDADRHFREGWLIVPQDRYEELWRLEGRHGSA